jgi:hypothetical protein
MESLKTHWRTLLWGFGAIFFAYRGLMNFENDKIVIGIFDLVLVIMYVYLAIRDYKRYEYED